MCTMLHFPLFLYLLFILPPALTVHHRPPSVTVLQDTVTASEPSVIRHLRQVTAATDLDYSWKATKKPSFITTQMKKELAEPILTVFPPDGAFRNGKSREIFLPEYNAGRRIIYHSTLPDVSSDVTRSPYNPYTEFIQPQRFDQRSYDANKVGHEFVTRVQSEVINIAGEEKNKGNRKSNPPIMIIDGPSPQYPVNSLNRIMQPVGYHNNKHMTGIAYHHQSPYHAQQRPYISDFKLPYSGSLPHFNGGNDFGIPQSHYQHQSSPYYEEVEKIHSPGYEHPHSQNYLQRLTSSSPYQSPPYPSRHVRFPPDRYPLNSALNDLLPSSKPYTTSLNSNPLDSGFLQHSSNLGFGNGLSSGFNVNDNLGPVTMDYNLDFDGNRFAGKPISLRNRFSNLNKYMDTSNNLNSDFHNSPFSDKPFDWEDFSSAAAAINDGVTGDKDFHIKGSSSFAETQNGIGNGANATAESVNTFKTPSTTSASEANNTEETSDYEGEANSS